LTVELYTRPFAQALATLKLNIALVSSPEAKANADIAQGLTAGAIHAFEYCYELAVKLMRRRLKAMAEIPQSIEDLDYRNLMRLAADKGLIDDPLQWDRFRALRNITSHTYHAAKAKEVFDDLPIFLATATRLLARLDEHGHNS
jgi:nucleotidyltransferase substrate binding protein (TIGR01987 family)